MRCLIVLSLSIFALAAADDEKCALAAKAGALGAGEDLLDAAMDFFAVSKRCGIKGSEVHCMIDSASAFQSTISMVNNILTVLDNCDKLHTPNKECGISSSRLTKNLAGLIASSGQVSQSCPAQNLLQKVTTGTFPAEHLAGCINNVKDMATGLFTLYGAIASSTKCENDADCGKAALRITDTLAGLGAYLSSSLGHCESVVNTITGGNTHNINSREALCAGAVSNVVKYSGRVAEAGMEMSHDCESDSSERLFSVEDQKETDHGNTSPNLLLAAFVPLAAVVGFVGGRFIGMRRRSDTRSLSTTSEVELE